MGTNYIAPIWRMPRNANNTPVDKLSNYSINFGGVSNYINCGGQSLFNGLTAFSVSCWIKRDGTQQAYASILTYQTSIYSYLKLFFSATGSSDKIEMLIQPGTTNTVRVISSAGSIPDGEWVHIAVVGDANNLSNLNMYINGVLDNDVTSANITTLAQSSDIYIGTDAGAIASREFKGEISQVCIFDYALTDGTGGTTNQIGYLYNLNNPMAITGGEPVAYWPLGDNSNPNAPGSFPNISVGADSVFDFDRTTNDFIAIDENNDKLFQGVDAFTVSAWANLNVSGGDQMIVGNDGSPRGFYMSMQSSPVLKFFISTTGSTNDQFTYTNPTATLNNWVHIVVIWDGTNMDMYVNGMYSKTQACVNATGTFTSPNGTTIGKRGQGDQVPTYDFDGQISNVQIWHQRLSHGTASVGDVAGGDIATLYNSGVPLMTGTQPQASNLKAWYKLDQSANWEADTSGNWQIPDAVSAYPQSFDFDITSNNYIITGTALGDDLGNYSGDLTISFWFNSQSAVSNNNGLFSIGNFLNDAGEIQIVLSNSGNYIRLGNAGSNRVTANITSYNDNNWHHFVFIYKAGDINNSTIYVDNSIPSITRQNSFPSSINLTGLKTIIGAYKTSAYTVDGLLSNVQLWNTALSSSQVETLYNNGVPLTTAIASDNLKLWSKLDNNELFDNTNWSVENQKYPANWESAISTNIGATTETDYVNLSSSFSTGGASDNSISFWLKTTQGSGDNTILGHAGSRYITVHFDKIRSNSTSGDGFRMSSNAVINDGVWHHVVYTYNQTSGAWKVYVDGDFDNSVTAATGQDVFPINRFGGKPGNVNFYYDGFISNVAYYDVELDASQVSTLYNNGTPEASISHSPISWWKLDNDNTGIQDSVGSNDGTKTGDIGPVDTFVSTQSGTSSGMTEQNLVNNNVSVLNGESVGMNTTNLVQSNLTRTQPFSNYSYNLDGGTEYWTAGTTLGDSLGNAYTGPISVSIWINTGSLTQEQGIFSLCKDDATLDELSISLNYDFGYYWTLNANGNDAYISTGSASITANTWHHLLCTFEPSAMKLYVDGQEISLSGTTTYTNLDLTGMETLIGGYYQIGVKEFLGYLSNCAVWNQILTQDDALNLYNNGVPQDLNNFRLTPIRWWSLDQNYSYWDGTNIIGRDEISGDDATGINIAQVDLEGNAPGSDANGEGSNLTIADLKGNMSDSDKNAYSINMADYADGVTNPANSGRSTDTP